MNGPRPESAARVAAPVMARVAARVMARVAARVARSVRSLLAPREGIEAVGLRSMGIGCGCVLLRSAARGARQLQFTPIHSNSLPFDSNWARLVGSGGHSGWPSAVPEVGWLIRAHSGPFPAHTWRIRGGTGWSCVRRHPEGVGAPGNPTQPRLARRALRHAAESQLARPIQGRLASKGPA